MKKLNLFKREKKEKKSFRYSVTLFICGYNLERWLNVLTTKNVKIFSVKKIDVKNSEIEVSVADEKAVVNFLKTKNIIVLNKKYNGFAKQIEFFRIRYGILIGVFVCFCFFIVASNYTWKVEVMGNEKRTDSEVISVLKENGIGLFSPLNSKSNEEIEKIILDNFDEVSMVSVVKKGSSIIINIKEKLFNEEYENLDKNQAVVATEDGLITSIELIQGTVLVKVGDIVRAGDALVAPYVIDSSGNKIPIQPKAKITADVWLSGQSTHENKTEITRRTGNYVTERKMTFLNQEIVTTKAEVPFIYYDLVVSEEYLSDYILPIKYITLHYYELESVIIEKNFSEVKDEKVLEAKELAKLRVLETDLIMNENFTISEKNGKTIVDFVITVRRNISG